MDGSTEFDGKTREYLYPPTALFRYLRLKAKTKSGYRRRVLKMKHWYYPMPAIALPVFRQENILWRVRVGIDNNPPKKSPTQKAAPVERLFGQHYWLYLNLILFKLFLFFFFCFFSYFFSIRKEKEKKITIQSALCSHSPPSRIRRHQR